MLHNASETVLTFLRFDLICNASDFFDKRENWF